MEAMTRPASRDTSDAFAAAARGDEVAFARIVESHDNEMYRVCVAVCRAALQRFALVLVCLPLAETQFHFDSPSFEIDAQRDQRVSFLLGQSLNTPNLTPMQEQSPGPVRFVG